MPTTIRETATRGSTSRKPRLVFLFLYSWLLFVAGLMCGANLEPQEILMALVISGFALGALIQLLEVRSSSRNRS
jgi:uncharacterized membrane protein YoaK (UPF0700 family)